MDLTENSALISSSQIQIEVRNSRIKAQQLKKSLGSFDVFVYVVSTLIGAGIYISPGLVARYTNNMGTSLIIWAVSGIVCLLGALSFCELAVAFKKTGNRYIFIKEAYGDIAGFCTIWAQTLIISPTCTASIALAMSEHVVEMIVEVSSEEGQWLTRIIAILCCTISVVINCISTSFSAKAQTAFAAVQVLGMFLFICTGIWKVSTGATQNIETMFEGSSDKNMDFNCLSLAFVSALWTYDGWGEIVSMNEELRDMDRNLRLGLITGMPFVIMCFLLFNLALMSMLTHAEMGRSITIATAFIGKSIGPKYAILVPIIVALSGFGSLNSTIMTSSRSILSASREGHLPQPLSYIHQNKCTPIPALLFLLILSFFWIIALGSQLVNLITYFSLGVWVTYGAALLAVIVLRIRRPNLERPYRVWLIHPIIATIASCYIIVAPFFKRPIQCVFCLCVLSSAVPVYYMVLYCVPESVKKYVDRFYSWMLDHLPLTECVFEMPALE